MQRRKQFICLIISELSVLDQLTLRKKCHRERWRRITAQFRAAGRSNHGKILTGRSQGPDTLLSVRLPWPRQPWEEVGFPDRQVSLKPISLMAKNKLRRLLTSFWMNPPLSRFPIPTMRLVTSFSRIQSTHVHVSFPSGTISSYAFVCDMKKWNEWSQWEESERALV